MDLTGRQLGTCGHGRGSGKRAGASFVQLVEEVVATCRLRD